ncbi:hypothetical protein EBR96_05965 [bacterium]|nr:hypothetical protein [bacterium]
MLGFSPVMASVSNSEIDQLIKRIESISEVKPAPVASVQGGFSVSPNKTTNYAEIHYEWVLDKQFGGFGSLRGCFNSPAGIVIDAQSVYVADKGNNRIVKIGRNYDHWDTFQLTSDTDFPLDSPSHLALIGPYVLVADSHNHRVIQFRSDGGYVGQFGELGISSGTFDEPNGLAQNSVREVLVCDTKNSRVQAFDERGRYLYELGQIGQEGQVLNEPVDLLILKDDSVVVADRANRTIKVFSRNGVFLASYFSDKSDTVRLESISGIAIDDRETIYVADPKGGKVVAFTFDGRILGIFYCSEPVDVACWGEWVFVTDSRQHRILQYRRSIL